MTIVKCPITVSLSLPSSLTQANNAHQNVILKPHRNYRNKKYMI